MKNWILITFLLIKLSTYCFQTTATEETAPAAQTNTSTTANQNGSDSHVIDNSNNTEASSDGLNATETSNNQTETDVGNEENDHRSNTTDPEGSSTSEVANNSSTSTPISETDGDANITGSHQTSVPPDIMANNESQSNHSDSSTVPSVVNEGNEEVPENTPNMNNNTGHDTTAENTTHTSDVNGNGTDTAEVNSTRTTAEPLPATAKQFVGALRFKEIEIGNEAIEWSDQLLDSSSGLAERVIHMLSEWLKTVYSPTSSYIGSKIITIRKGSIVVLYELYFTQEAEVIADGLKKIMRDHLHGVGCLDTSDTCNVTGLGIINVTSINVSAKAFCDSPSTNACDPVSTHCVSHSNGSYGCTCRPGYQPWKDVEFLCRDIDECLDNSTHGCNHNTSRCVNNPGSYRCECQNGFKKIPKKGCVDVCQPNPCKHGGECQRERNRHVCLCTDDWLGENCDEENRAAQRWRTIAIVVAVLTSLLCVVLLTACLIACFRSRQSPRRRGTMTQRLEVRLDDWQYEQQNCGYQMVDAAEDSVSSFTGGNVNPAYLQSNGKPAEDKVISAKVN